MKFPSFIQRRLHWINLPTLTLLTLLQRTPVVRVVVAAGDFVLSSPLGNVLKSTLATAVTLGALNSRAGATEVTASPGTPASATVGQAVTVVFGTLGTQSAPDSWTVGGSPPPGLNFSGQNSGELILSGTPTTAGNYSMTITGDTALYGSTPQLTYMMNVTGAVNSAPGFTTQPQTQTVVVGSNVTFTVAVTGSPTPTLQWKKDGGDISGQTGTSLALTNVQLGAAATYTVVATNSVSSVSSTGAVLTVNAAPAITTQPQGQTVAAGANVTFTAAASGTPTPTYQWKKDGTAINGATSATLSLNGVQTGDAGNYTVVATNSVNSATSNIAALVVTATPMAPAITTQPQSQTVLAGATVTLTAVASGVPVPTYQWQKDNVNINGATDATLSLANAQVSDSGSYTLVATNATSSATSNAAVVTVNPVPPTITAQPQSHSIATGSMAVMGVQASGSGLTYQWSKDGVAVPNATSTRLIITSSQPSDAGSYTVVINGTGGGTVTSSAGVLTVVTTSEPGRIINLSINGTSGTGNKVLIMGFVTGGDGTGGNTGLLLRGVGPSIIGQSNGLADPAIRLIPGGSATDLADNDDWGGTAELKTAASSTGAFPLNSDTSKDAALVDNFPRNLYSVVVTGKNGTSGPVLAEIYDTSVVHAYDPTIPRLINISARAFVGPTDALTAGFVIIGQTAQTVLVRGVGPDPTFTANVGNASVGDPSLLFYHAHDGISELILTNDNWGGDPQLTTVGTSLGAATLTDPNSKDAAVLVTLDPGVYSVQLTPLNGTSGITLIEVYAAP